MSFETEGNFLFKMEVTETVMPKKLNWLSEYEDAFDEEDFKYNQYELFFPNFEEMSNKITEITEGYNQYWADVIFDFQGSNVESLEYHNGHEEWDKEINISTSRFYLTDSFWDAMDKWKENQNLL
ncbi:hypothetical protein EVU96_09115 [Bacillus infantis]|uniref:hypothetical protein n=1 Tax=Bacillus infantis TaxID=324767 RepID=UPI00101C2702|nr:hypothetical protein [Bacillus infantis]RYI30565.1 hypothetical protein EVU96_09115 [Bacillus infantis]